MSKRKRTSEKSRSRDDRVAIPLSPDDALKGLLAVDPDSEPPEDDREVNQG
jgi:hypothetical protein